MSGGNFFPSERLAVCTTTAEVGHGRVRVGIRRKKKKILYVLGKSDEGARAMCGEVKSVATCAVSRRPEAAGDGLTYSDTEQ